jgi:hypothetical protein
MKRMAIFAVVVASLGFGGGSALAAGGGATVDTFPVNFVLSSATCSNLPDGTTITGSGTETSMTTIRTDRSGVTMIVNATHARGIATDQAGNEYVFNYSNEFRVSDTTANPGTFSGLMTDSFSLSGSGPARLSNGFTAGITTDFASFGFQELNSRGDPIDFATGTAICDPL